MFRVYLPIRKRPNTWEILLNFQNPLVLVCWRRRVSQLLGDESFYCEKLGVIQLL